MKGALEDADVGTRSRGSGHAQAVLKAAARALRRPRAGGARARRPLDPRPDLRPQAEARRPRDYARKLVAELWLYPETRRILELSTKCAPAEAFQVAAETRAS